MKLHQTTPQRSDIRPADETLISSNKWQRDHLDMTQTNGVLHPEGIDHNAGLDHTYTDWIKAAMLNASMPTIPPREPTGLTYEDGTPVEWHEIEPVILNHPPVASVAATEQIRNVEPPITRKR